MFNRRDKIIKKAGEEPTDLEQEVAKQIGIIENNNKAAKLHLSIIFINSVNNVDYEQADGSAGQYMLIRIPHRSLGAFRKVGSLVQEHLEAHYERPVMIVANRTILSPSALRHPTQMRPRSRTLTNVNQEILADVCFPSHIAGRSVRVCADGRKIQKVNLDPLDQETMTDRISAIAHCYHALTTHKITFGFAKPTAFQQKIIDNRQK